jgi:DNA-binding MarR family transcriptional regulator
MRYRHDRPRNHIIRHGDRTHALEDSGGPACTLNDSKRRIAAGKGESMSGDDAPVESPSQETLRVPGAAYLLSQVGAHSSRRWQERLAPIGLDARSVLVLRHVAAEQGRTQSSLSASLAVPPSRIVAIVDELERRGLLERRAHPSDRRAHALRLTRRGREVLDELLAISRAHEAEICSGLRESERERLIELLEVIVSEQGLARGSHPRLGQPPDRRR